MEVSLPSVPANDVMLAITDDASPIEVLELAIRACRQHRRSPGLRLDISSTDWETAQRELESLQNKMIDDKG